MDTLTNNKSPYRFSDRSEAAHALAAQLRQYAGRHPLILAIPRGAVPMGKILADQLGGELDIVMVRKLGAPFNAEYALGAIDESGWMYLSDTSKADSTLHHHLEREKQRQLDVLAKRRLQYTPSKSAIDPKGRVVIVVDDGLATGATMIAALHAIGAKQPAELICAVPVAPPETLEIIKPLADSVVCLQAPENFMAVGQFYVDFAQVSDEDVIALLGTQRQVSNETMKQ